MAKQARPIILPRATLQLQTRCCRDVTNFINRAAATVGMAKQVADYRKKFSSALHRTSNPCATYNCHGLTFAARRAQINDPADVAMILADDDCDPILEAKVLPGDIAVYYNDGDIEHSGVVVDNDEKGPKILSKWGAAHEVIHRKTDCEYNAADVRFYRINK